MVRRRSPAERRAWARLPLPVPVFVRSRNRKGKDFLEFASALNISAGGALVAIHGLIRPSAQVSLQIPSAPIPSSVAVRKNTRNLRATIVRVTHGDGYNLVALRFVEPILPIKDSRKRMRRKLASSV
ncbi:MAG TPA: PilZ domain-containing protein [Terriglobales bacterium]|nr:PilZ domain-containing protein [Terriglobales bacterium]